MDGKKKRLNRILLFEPFTYFETVQLVLAGISVGIGIGIMIMASLK